MKVRDLNRHDVDPAKWIDLQVTEWESKSVTNLNIPKRDDGKEYCVDSLYPDQQEIVAVVLNTLREFLECDDLKQFVPLRLTIVGQGGSGKSVVINTIVAVMRSMFNCNQVVKVMAPTGTAAYNVGGETIHHMLRMGVSSSSDRKLNQSTRKALISKFEILLALIIDERSMVSSNTLGCAEDSISKTIYGGGHMSTKSFGGLPIVILVGDDFQLPSIGEGALTALYNRNCSRLTNLGRQTFLECSENVLKLSSSKRLSDDAKEEKELMSRLRDPENLRDDDINRLLKLDLRNVQEIHGQDIVDVIRSKAIYLFFKNSKRIHHNLVKLNEDSGPDNPVAVVRSYRDSTVSAVSNRSHFDSKMPGSAMLCCGCTVALSCRNIHPQWGLHNGASGTVDEIVFAKGDSPNNGDDPLYVVVDFPNYRGPIWDKNNPTVSYSCQITTT